MRILKSAWIALKEFLKEGGIDKASILAYYSIFSFLSLLTFFTFLFTRFLGDPEITIKSMYPFSRDFFSSISPGIFAKAHDISTRLKEIGIIGIVIFLFFGFLIIKKIVQFINEMFNIHLKDTRREKGFLVRRVSEFGLLFVVGILVIVSFLFTGFISAVTTLFYENEFLSSHIDAGFVRLVDNFLIYYVAPFLVTFLLFFVLYKWIPEKKVYVKGACISALFAAILWELLKKGYSYYLVNISVFGKIKGPVIAIILFGFWMEISMGIMLYGARLTYIFDRGKNGQTKRNK